MYHTYKKSMLFALAGAVLLATAGCGGGGGGTTPAVNTGVIVTPNLGLTTGSTVTITDLVTNQLIGTINTQNTNGSFQVPANLTTNPVRIQVTGGTYFDEATGAQQPLPAAGVSVVLPDPNIAQVAITPVTEIATQAAAKATGPNVTPTELAILIDNANKNTGSALLGGADPTTTIPFDITQPIPAGATPAQQNYTRLLGGLADYAAANNGGDLAAAALALSNALFDVNGAPATGPAPAALTRLQTAVINFTAPAGVPAANVPPPSSTVVIGPVNTAMVAVNGNQFYFMEVLMDSNSVAGTPSQTTYTEIAMGLQTPSVSNNNVVWNETLTVVGGAPVPVIGQGTNPIAFTANNEYQLINRQGSPISYSFSRDGEFAVGENIQTNGGETVRLSFLVKRPVTAPTVASVAGAYKVVIMGRDHSVVGTALPGYIENGIITLDGAGAVSFALVKTVPPAVASAPVNGVISTYTVDAATGAVVMNAAGNAHIVLSENGQYGLYELHSAANAIQEWGIVIKQHASTIPFTAMQNGLMYDVHNQGPAPLLKAIDFRTLAPTVGSLATDTLATSVKAFAPAQLSPNLWCGTTALPALAAFPTAIPAIPATPARIATAPCSLTRDLPLRFYPVAPNVASSAANGEFTTMIPKLFGQLPNFVGYVSQNADVSWIDDGEAGSIIITLGR